VIDAGVDLFVIRGTTVSAEHVSGRADAAPWARDVTLLELPLHHLRDLPTAVRASLDLVTTAPAG
ncbi:GuaB3 family IMP dehydrogenase-related protein, partial [Actinomadura luteofluorescens]